MNPRIYRWSGSDLGPLPHESSFSVLIRFAWRNAIDEKVQLELLGLKRIYKTQHFCRPNWLNTITPLSVALEWEFPAKSETEVLSAFSGLENVFFSRSLRICPLCLRSAFHSHWHQFLLLKKCPVHGIQLKDKCLSCHEPLAEYSFSKPLMGKPFLCHTCKHPISGTPVKLADHLRIRTASCRLREKFELLHNWLRRNHDALRFLNELRLDHGGSLDRLNAWCNADRFVKDVFLRSAFDPQLGLVKARSHVTLLSWKVKMRTTGREISYGSGATTLRERLIRRVYRATIRRLANWIIDEGESRDDCQVPDVQAKGSVIRTAGVPPNVLAYHLMRISLEYYEPVALARDVRASAPRYDLIPPEYAYEGRQPKLAWRAIFLGVYASMFCLAVQSKAKGKTLNLREIRMRIDATNAKVLFLEGTDILCGEIVFPTVPGMPTAPFRNTQLGSNVKFIQRM